MFYNAGMKKSLITFCLVVIFSASSFGMPLVHKATFKIIGSADAFVFDSSKYKDLRIGIVSETDNVEIQFDLFAVEGEDEIFIRGDLFIQGDRNTLTFNIENAPSRIKIKPKKSGNYRIYIWAK